jgi:hypothetical protein
MTRLLLLASLLLCASPSFAAITEVQAPTENNYAGCGGVTTCDFAFGSNVTSGNVLVVGSDISSTTTQTPSGIGAGCSATTWTLQGTAQTSHTLRVWTGYASGSGACTVRITVGVATTVGQLLAEYSGVDSTIAVDATGQGSGTLTTITVNASPSARRNSEWGITIWGDVASSNPAATGWTSVIGSNFHGWLKQTGIALNTAVQFAGTGFPNGSEQDVIVITLEPPPTTNGGFGGAGGFGGHGGIG